MIIHRREQAEISIQPIRAIKGGLPQRALSLVVEWAALHQEELLENWRRLHTAGGEMPARIPPLE